MHLRINDTYLVINVCRSGLMSRSIFLIWGSKPISSILSASSRTYIRTYIQCAGKGQWDYVCTYNCIPPAVRIWVHDYPATFVCNHSTYVHQTHMSMQTSDIQNIWARSPCGHSPGTNMRIMYIRMYVRTWLKHSWSSLHCQLLVVSCIIYGSCVFDPFQSPREHCTW